ncbi:ABC transporter permease [[Clostridium] fimetarium]|uniref:Putative ABC transport system permease protein n=1 Tax=[Clostridium] fimetarium TaxID=99656 RepID=A0A1I0R9U0_9FIRM|nr:ABC transporter permease [[Clostridium] fimetarium]SEW37480.1 putative ABC transport system permease protein [[Clostridium] fimetarium]
MIIRNVRFAWESIKEGKTKSILSIIGIVMSVITIVVVMSLTSALSDFVENGYKSVGEDLMWVSTDTNNSVAGSSGLQIDDENHIKNLSFVKNASPYSVMSESISVNGVSGNISVAGVNDQYSQIMNMNVYDRFINASEYENGSKVCVISDMVRKKFLYKNIDPVGEQINISGNYYTIIGCILPPETDTDSGMESENCIYIPYTTFSKDYSKTNIEMIRFTVNDVTQISKYKSEINILLSNLTNQGYTYKIKSVMTELASAKDIFTYINAFSIVITSITMIISGIGIMNVILMSIFEKKWEIGLRKAVGASKKEILMQFLFESLFFSVFGVTIGVVLSWALIVIISFISGINIIVSGSAIILGVSLSMIVCLFFGISPAIRAARMNPLECLEKN